MLTGEKIDDVYGVYATGTSNVVETTMDQIDVQSNRDMKIDGTTYKTKGAAVYQDLEMNERGWPWNTETAQTIDDVFTSNGEKVADDVKLIDWDNDDDYETILVSTVAVAEVSYVGSSSVTLGSYAPALAISWTTTSFWTSMTTPSMRTLRRTTTQSLP